jgi:hypothetical protein
LNHHRENRIQFQPVRAGFDIVGLSIHRPDLAWHHEAGWGGAGARPLRNAIVRQRDGRSVVSDPSMRAQILRLRSDSQASAMLAGALTQRRMTLILSLYLAGRRTESNKKCQKMAYF